MFEIKKGMLIKYHGNAEEVVIPDTVTIIGMMAFINCRSLKKVIIPRSVKLIKNMAFYHCEGLQEVVFSETLETIGSSAFRGCVCLSSAGGCRV